MSVTNQLPVRRLQYSQLHYNKRSSASHRSFLTLEASSNNAVFIRNPLNQNQFSFSTVNYRAASGDSDNKSCGFVFPSRQYSTSTKFSNARLTCLNGRYHSHSKGSACITFATRPFSTSSSDASEQKDQTSPPSHSPANTDKDRYYYLIKQKYSPSRHQKYRPRREDGKLEKTVSNKPLNQRIIQSYTDIVAYFMPKGYPQSVGKGYRNFAAGQMVSMVLSSAGGVLSMQSLLCAIGIGASEALPLAATLNWVIKDGLGQLGGVIFASVVSNRFDADPKRWRMLASLSMDVASFIELLTPFFPGYFLPLASVANVGKNISFLAASASRAAIHKTFAVHENLADITAKTGSQCILGAMLGTGLGIATVALIGDSYVHTFAAFSTFTALSLGSTYISLKSAILPSLSIARLDVILQHHFIFEFKDLKTDRNLGPGFAFGVGDDNDLARVYSDPSPILDPAKLADMEAYLGSKPVPGLPPLFVGADLTQAILSEEELRRLLEIFRHDQYMISIRKPSASTCEVHLLLKEKCTKQDLLLGLVHAFIVRYAMKSKGFQGASKLDISQHLNLKQNDKASESTYDILVRTRSLLLRKADSESSSGSTAVIEGESELTVGHSTVQQVLRSQWLVEELLLETRHARLEIKKE